MALDLANRMGFSDELLEDCGPDSPPAYQQWLREKRRTSVPPGEFWFYVNNLVPPDSEQSTAEAIKRQLGQQGRGLLVRVFTRY
jgi:hypothetical protein